MRILFCNIAWMNYYKGIIQGKDEPQNGGSYVKENLMRTKSIILMQYHLQMNQDIRMVSIASDLWRRNLQIKKQEIS